MAICFGVMLLIALGRFGPGSATISAKGVGPLEIGKATRTQMQSFDRGRIDFWLTQKGNPPLHFKGQLWQYGCIGQRTSFGASCRTLYGITNGHVATVETTSPRFFTSAKTHVGTPLSQARRQEHGKWTGWNVKCPHLILAAPKGVVFFASVSKDKFYSKSFVSGFYLSATPSSFAYCSGQLGRAADNRDGQVAGQGLSPRRLARSARVSTLLEAAGTPVAATRG
jgi:hypothetical protein